MRLTDEMKFEFQVMAKRVDELYCEFDYGAKFIPPRGIDLRNYTSTIKEMKQTSLSEVESFKVKLENFYSETDVKEELKS